MQAHSCKGKKTSVEIVMDETVTEVLGDLLLFSRNEQIVGAEEGGSEI